MATFQFSTAKRACKMATGLLGLLVAIWPTVGLAQQLLDGEFGDIDLGRELIEPDRFPTITELRQAVGRPEISFVMMFKLYGDADNHHLPVWSWDGQRLAMQRSKVGVDSSKLLLYQALSQPEPLLLTTDADAYDYMFRWGLNSDSSFAFARIESGKSSTHVYYSQDGSNLQLRTPGQGQYFYYPALYERTDGVHWLAYEHDGNLVQQAWKGEQTQEKTIARGTSPRWTRDGKHLLMARQRGSGGLASFEVVVRSMREGTDLVLPTPSGRLVRSPVWSPDERQVACYVRGPNEGDPWEIVVGPATGDTALRSVATDVVVNADFKSEGPSWEPQGQRVWCFSHAYRQQEYYPLVGAACQSGQTAVVDYPKRCTSPNDLAVNPTTEIPEFAFVAHVGLPQDLFVLFLNHY